MHTYVKNFMKYKYLMEQLIVKEIKLKYRSSVLGIFWTLLEPLLHMIVLSYVFSTLFGKTDAHFPVYVLIGRLIYSFFANSTKAATKSIRKNSAVIKKVYVPKYIYIFSTTFANYIIFLISLLLLLPVGAVFHVSLSVHMLYAVIPTLIILLIATGCGMILATMTVFFKDMEYIWGVALMLIMYTCAIFYPVKNLAKTGKEWVLKMNPIYACINNFRNAVLGNSFDSYSFWYSLLFGVAVFLIGTLMFCKKQDKFILYI